MRVLSAPLLLFLSLSLFGGIENSFKLYKKGASDINSTLLVIGGVHGDEPGGYFAASFLVKHYSVSKGSLWIVPNLNFKSILRFKRGMHGDMNRKFAEIKKNDPDYEAIQRIKKIILSPEVGLVLNLHDGRGYYRDKWKNSIFNPYAWGQACIIDQETLDFGKFTDLNGLADKVNRALNENGLKEPHHKFHIKNTKTKDKDEQMRLSLTYFAITNKKPALAIETSKNIKDLSLKVFYQLKAIEEFMKIMGIEFQREFELDLENIYKLIKNSGSFVTFNNNYTLPLDGLRNYIYYFPICENRVNIKSDDPLVGARESNDGYLLLQRGHMIKARLKPQYFPKCEKIESFKLDIDGKEIVAKIGQIVNAEESFTVKKKDGVRVNIIGWSKRGVKDESNIKVYKKDILKRFSIDKKGSIFRIEFYREDGFIGAILINFLK